MTKPKRKNATLHTEPAYVFPHLRITGLDADRTASVFRLFVFCVELWGGAVSGGPVIERKASK